MVVSLIAFVGVMLWVDDGAAKSRAVFLILGFYTGVVAIDGLRRGVVLSGSLEFKRSSQPVLFSVGVATSAALSLTSVACALAL